MLLINSLLGTIPTMTAHRTYCNQPPVPYQRSPQLPNTSRAQSRAPHLTLINTVLVYHVDADDVDQCDDCGTDPDDGDDDRAGACGDHGHDYQVVVIHVFYCVSSPPELGVNPRMIGVSIAPKPLLLNYCCVSRCAMKV